MNLHKSLGVTAGIALISLICLGTLAGAAEPVVLQALISGNQEYIANTRLVFDQFEAANPDIKIELITTDDVGPKFLTMYAGGVAPDLLRMRGTEPADFGTEGMLLDLTDWIERDQVPLEDFIPPAVPSLGWAGRIYSLPLGVAIQAILFNKDLFDQAGVGYPNASWSWEREVVTQGKKLTLDTNADGVIDQFFLGNMAILEWFPFVYAACGELFSEDGKRFLANSPAGIDGLQFAADLKNVYHIIQYENEVGGPWKFISGNVAFNISGSWTVGDLRSADVSFDWDAAIIPTFRDSRATNLWPETPWGIPNTSKHQEEAWRVLKYIVSREGQEAVARLGLAVPIRVSVATSSVYTQQRPPDNIINFIESALAPRTRALPAIPGWNSVLPILEHEVTRPVYRGDLPATVALESVEGKINTTLAKVHQMLSRKRR